MNEIFLFVKKLTLFIVGFLLVLFFQRFIINSSVKLIKVGEYGVLNSIDKGIINADVIVSGSSRALKAIHPKVIEEMTGMSCYNIASDGSDLGVQLPKFKWYMQKNKKPKILIQDISQFGGSISKSIYEPFKYLPYLNNDFLFEGLNQIDPDIWYSKYIYPANLIYYNFDFYVKLIQGLLNTVNDKDPFIQGYLPDNSKWSGNFDQYKKNNPSGITCSISEDLKTYLNKLVDYCEENNITLFLVLIPNYYKLKEITSGEDDVFNYYKHLENNTNITYLNFTDDSLAHSEKNFYNLTHLNSTGAKKFSNILSNELIKIKEVL